MKKKFKTFLAVLLILAGLLLVDLYRYYQVELDMTGMMPEKAVAVSTQPVRLTITARYKNGKPVVNHTLYALTLGGGSWESYYAKTDEKGVAVFTYYPYDLPSYQQPRDVLVKIRDESNSLFVEMYPTLEYSIKLIKPGDSQNNSGTVDDYLN